MKLHIKCAMLGFVFVLCAQCSKKSNISIQNNPETYKDYILAYTSGILKRSEPFRIEFTKPLVSSDKINQVVDSKLFNIIPELKGKCIWKSLNVIEFIPEKSNLKGNQEYKFSVDLKNLFPEIATAVKDISILFSYMPITLQFNWFFPRPDLVENNMMYLAGTIETNDILDPAQLIESIKVNFGPNKLELKPEISTNAINPHHYDVLIRHIPRLEKTENIFLEWKDQLENNTLSPKLEKIKIPARQDFEVTGVDDALIKDNLLTIYFSNFLNVSQDIKGLVIFKDDSSSIELNKEKDFIQVRIPENWQKTSGILEVKHALLDDNSKSLKANFQFQFLVNPNPPQVRFVSKGTVLPYTKDIVLPFEAINLHTVEVDVFKTFTNNVLYSFHLGFDNEYDSYNLIRLGKVIKQKVINLAELAPGNNEKEWKRYGLDLSELIENEPGAYYQVRITFKPSYSNYSCDRNKPEIPEDFYQTETGDPKIKSLWRDYPYWHYTGDDDGESYDVTNPCNIEYYSKEHFAKTSFCASNIALSVKAGHDPGNSSAFVFDVIDGSPVKGAEIQFFDAQLQEISRLKTDGNGLAVANLNTLPSFVIAKYENHYAYLKINENKSLSQSEFDISGIKVQEGLKASLYTERGVWRPGDTIYFNAVIFDILRPLPNNFPISLTLRNPKNQIIYSETKSSHLLGLFNFQIPTASNSITGVYTAHISAGPSVFEKNILLETIKPNRYKVEWPDIERTGLDKIKDKINLKAYWMHGAPASEAMANVKWKYQLVAPEFNAFKEYQFIDPISQHVSGEIEIFNSKLNESGEAVVKLPDWKFSTNTGKLKVNLISKISDHTGEISTDYFESSLSPFKELVGIKLPSNGMSRHLETGMEHEVRFVSVNADGSPIANRKLDIELFVVEYQWWYELRNGNSGAYQNSQFKERVLQKSITTDLNGLATLKLNLDDYERYYIRAKNTSSGYLTGDYFYTSYGSDADHKEFVNILSFKTDKEQYQTGDQVILNLPGASQGYYIISLIRGSKILETKTLPATSGSTHYSFNVRSEMAPNIYADISYVQGRASKNNDLPLRMYGVIPIKIDDPAQKLLPNIKMSESVHAEEKFSIEISEQNGKAMAYQLFIVDEGLLNLTRFKTPNPYNDILAREALSIFTWDNIDEVVGAMDGELIKVFSIGGDEAYNKTSDEDKNKRFKPVILRSEPIFLAKGSKYKHEFVINNYFGAVRVMVLANSSNAFGAMDKTVKVRNELMAQITAPRVFAHTDEVQIPVTVFTTDPSIKEVNLTLETSGKIKIKDLGPKKIYFNSPGDQTVYFTVKASGGIGNAKLTTKAISGNFKSSTSVEFYVDNPNSISHNIKEYWIEPGKSVRENIIPFGMEGTRSVEIEVSGIPGLSIRKMIDELLRYPHGCVEQTISAAFPQTQLNKLFELTTKQIEEANFNVHKAVEKLRFFQIADGSFSYWPGVSNYTDWGTTYAGHFLIEARNSGYHIPEELLQKWYKFQKSKSGHSLNINKNSENWYTTNYAYRLYTLSLYGKPDWSAMNQLYVAKTDNTFSKVLLAGAYALGGKKDIAEKLLEGGTYEIKAYKDDYFNYGSDIRDEAMIAQVLQLMGRQQEALNILNRVIKRSMHSGYSTQEQSMLLLCISALSGNAKLGKMDFEYTWNSKSEQISSTKEQYDITAIPNVLQEFKFKNNSNRPLSVKVIQYGKDILMSDQNIDKGIKMDVIMPASGRVFQIGDELECEVIISNPVTNGRLSNVALTTIFPTGFEIENRRIAGLEDTQVVFDYQDYRDDRVFSYFSINAGQKIVVKFKLTAAYPGKYIAPYFYCEAMYDPSIYAKYRVGNYSIVPRK